jgi:hypothetical protein
MGMTYRKLAEFITTTFSHDQLDQDITVCVGSIDEYYPLDKIVFATNGSILFEEGQPILQIDGPNSINLDETADEVCSECETPTRCQSCEFNAAINRVAKGEEP